MRKINLLLIGILLALGISVSAQNPKTIVTGRVINRATTDPAVMTWNLCDPVCDERMGLRLTDDGWFRFETDGITCFHNATLNYGRFINFFIAPGDRVSLEINAAKLRSGAPDAICFSGDHAEENAQLYACYNAITQIMNADTLPFDMEASPSALAATVQARAAQYEKTLGLYSLSSEVRDFMQRDILFSIANQLQGYKPDDPAARLELFGDPLFGLSDTANLHTMMFPYHLSSYALTKAYADTTVEGAVRRGDWPTAVRRTLFLFSGEPATANRDIMLWQFLSGILEVYPELCDSVPEATDALLDPALGARLEALCRKMSGVPSFPDTPVKGVAYLNADSIVTAVPEVDIFAYLTAKYPRKVLYIDVYATWCGPCRAEMKEASALHKRMSGKDVVFVNLCLGSDQETWRKTIVQMRLGGEHYWFDHDATQLFLGAYNLPGYPTYILVGRDGRIVTMKAERPSALTRTAGQIDGLL